MKKENPNKIIAGRSYREILDRYEKKINDPRITKTGKQNCKIIMKYSDYINSVHFKHKKISYNLFNTYPDIVD